MDKKWLWLQYYSRNFNILENRWVVGPNQPIHENHSETVAPTNLATKSIDGIFLVQRNEGTKSQISFISTTYKQNSLKMSVFNYFLIYFYLICQIQSRWIISATIKK